MLPHPCDNDRLIIQLESDSLRIHHAIACGRRARKPLDSGRLVEAERCTHYCGIAHMKSEIAGFADQAGEDFFHPLDCGAQSSGASGVTVPASSFMNQDIEYAACMDFARGMPACARFTYPDDA